MDIIESQEPFQGGQLSKHLNKWMEITTDPIVLDIVQHYHIEFDFEPSPEISRSNSAEKFSLLEQSVIDQEIETFRNKGIIEISQHETGEIISPIFIRPKKEPGKFRVIFNLKNLNESVTYYKFKMDTLETAIKLMTPQCYMSSIDLRDAYYSIAMATEHRRFLKFEWRDSLYQFCALPMGLSSSPRIFTKVLKPVFATLRATYGHSCLGYIDDSFYCENTFLDCQKATLDAVRLFNDLGFAVHPLKSSLVPDQTLEFLGFVLNSNSMTVTVTESKIERIILLCQQFHRLKICSIREVGSLIGTLISTFPGNEMGPLHYRSLEREKDIALKRAQGDYDDCMSLSHESKQQLEWWIDNISTSSRQIDHGKPSITLTSDASLSGWGAVVDERQTQGLWSLEEQALHINALELSAINMGLKALLPMENNKHIRIMSDSSTAVSYINAMGGIKSLECDKIAYDIWTWASKRKLWLSAAHTPGTSNELADKLSRQFHNDVEWQLNRVIFGTLTQHFGVPDIDLFASRINHQVTKYVSWKPDPYAVHIDAFTLDWGDVSLAYIFPPFCIIGRCLQKILLEKATAIIIVPCWSTQPWFTRLLSLLVDCPMLIQVIEGTLFHPKLGQVHPLSPKLHLLACKVSGQLSCQKAFHQTLQISSWSHGDPAHRNSTMLTSENGQSFVLRGKLIPCNRM